MSTSFHCASCGELHGLPFAYGTDAPYYWEPQVEAEGRGTLGEEQCEIDEHLFVRGRLCVPVLDADEDFEWGVWTTLSPESYLRMSDLWETPGREAEPPFFGWLSTELPGYEPSTLNLKTSVQIQPVGERPTIALEPTDHPLAVEQREGITVERVRRIALELLHPDE